MGQLAYSAAGAAVGFAIGGPQGAQIGWAIGGMVGSVIDPPKLPDGPRIDDLTVQVSTYGQPIPRRWGTVRMAGNVIWATPLIETPSETGGKGGPSQTTYSYACSFAVGLCEGTATGVARIWADGKLIYDVRPANTENQIGFTATSFVFYPGTEDQDVDPTIQAYMGDAPAYRGLVYVVFTDLQLAHFGNRIPNLTFEVCDGPIAQLAPIQWGERYQTLGDVFEADLASDGSLYVSTMDGHYDDSYLEFFENGLNFSAAGTPQIQRYDAATRKLIWGKQVPQSQILDPIDGSVAWTYHAIEGTGVCYGDRYFVGSGRLGQPRFSGQVCPPPHPPCANPQPYTHGWVVGAEGVLSGIVDVASSGQFQNAFYWPWTPVVPYYDRELVYMMSGNGLIDTFGVGFEFDGLAQKRGTGSCACNSGLPPSAFDGESWSSPSWVFDVVKVPDGVLMQGYAGTTRNYMARGGFDPTVYLYEGSGVRMPAAIYDPARETVWVFAGTDYNVLYSYGAATGFLFPPIPGESQGGEVKGLCIDTATGFLRVLKGGGFGQPAYLVLLNPDTGTVVNEIEFAGSALTLVSNTTGKMYDLPRQRAVVYHDGYRIYTIPYGQTIDPQPVPLWQIVRDLSVASGMSVDDIDTAELTDLVWGFLVGRQGTARGAIEQLMVAFLFDAVESEGKVKFVKRGRAPVREIHADDLSAHERGQQRPVPVALTRIDEAELPKVVTVKYINAGSDYQTGAQESRRQTGRASAEITIDVPVALSDGHAKAIADHALYATWAGRTRAVWSTTLKHADLEPTDVVRIDGNPIRIAKRSLAGNVLRWEGEFDTGTTLTAGAVAGGGALYPAGTAPGVQVLPATVLLLMDMPLVTDADDGAGFYAAARGAATPWPGAALHISSDGGGSYSSIATFSGAVVHGAALDALGDFSRNMVDEFNLVRVSVTGTLSSVTELAMLNGANIALLGRELIQFKRAVLNPDSTYTLSGLLRGRKGSPTTGHITGERFVLIDPAVQRIAAAAATIGLSRTYKAPTLGTSLESAPVVYFTNHAIGLQPLSGVLLGGGRDAAGNLTVNWTRRTRIDGGWRDNVDAGLGETAENYTVEIYNSPSHITVLRTVHTTTPALVYTAAQQTTDFGSAQSAVSMRIYQLSSTYGRGAVLEGTV